MRIIISITLLLVYLIPAIRAYYPYVDYAINKDYIAKVLCINKDEPKMQCNGKCHLTKQLKEASEEENKDKPFTPPKTEVKETLFVHHAEQWQNLKPIECSISKNSYFTFTVSQAFVEIPTPPPKYSLC